MNELIQKAFNNFFQKKKKKKKIHPIWFDYLNAVVNMKLTKAAWHPNQNFIKRNLIYQCCVDSFTQSL